MDPQTIMFRLRWLGIKLLGGRNTALRELVVQAPPPLVAEMLGYSYQVAERHAELAAQQWSRYVTREKRMELRANHFPCRRYVTLLSMPMSKSDRRRVASVEGTPNGQMPTRDEPGCAARRPDVAVSQCLRLFLAGGESDHSRSYDIC
jgi:hypothetical protein